MESIGDQTKKVFRKEVCKSLFISFFTSIIGPCVCVDPRSPMIFFASSLSMIGQVTLMASLQVIAYFNENLLQQQTRQQMQILETFCWVFIPIIVLTSFCSYLITEDTRQFLSLKIGLGSVTCDDKEQFHWACEREYPLLINYYLDSAKLLNIFDTDVNGLNGLEFSYQNRRFKVRYKIQFLIIIYSLSKSIPVMRSLLVMR